MIFSQEKFTVFRLKTLEEDSSIQWQNPESSMTAMRQLSSNLRPRHQQQFGPKEAQNIQCRPP